MDHTQPCDATEKRSGRGISSLAATIPSCWRMRATKGHFLTFGKLTVDAAAEQLLHRSAREVFGFYIHGRWVELASRKSELS
jgi:hypothetical protein